MKIFNANVDIFQKNNFVDILKKIMLIGPNLKSL